MAELSGIYKIQSITKPERCYIGSAVNIASRWRKHLCNLRLNKNEPNKKIQNHYNKYGKNDLIFSILIGCDKSDLITTEQFFIDAEKPWFNVRTKAESNFGVKASEETRNKLSAKRHSLETKRRISEGGKGRIVYEETRKKIGDAQRGKKRPWQAGEKHHNFGKAYSPEMREKMRQARKKQTTTRKGVPCSEETKQKLRLINIGKHASEETKQKMRETMIRIGNKPPSAKGTSPWNKGLKKIAGAEGKITKLKVA